MHLRRGRDSWLLLLVGAGILASASARAEPEIRRALPIEESPERSGRVTLDDEALFLAGISGSGSPLNRLEGTSAWRQHKEDFDALWRKVKLGRHAKMREWASSEVLPRVGQPRTIFYMFGGPDFVTPQVFFPGTPVIISGGLEPVGQVPDLRSLSDSQLASSLGNLRRSMDGVLRLGFFETKDMRADLNRTPVQGVKPIVLAMMARNGLRPIDASYFTLSSGGSPSYTESTPSGAVTGLKITYQPRSGGGVRSFYYVSGNIANGGETRRIQSFLSRFKPAGSYLKAASYLMHEGDFSSIREFLLNNSTFILQDDSGIPLRAFDPGRWDILYFGNYHGVMRVFGKYYQPELADIYRRSGGRAMPFGLGYRTRDSEASQILAIRR